MVRGSNALQALLSQINAKFPYRDKASDGGIGDAAHSSRVSDHNPDQNGIYHARDYDHDPDANGLNCVTLKRDLVNSGDPRIKYIIFQRLIWTPGVGNRAYTGVNAHTQHLHLSVYGDNGSTWRLPYLTGGVPISTPPGGGAPQAYGLPIGKVRELQRVLNAWYPGVVKLVVDGDYGPATKNAVMYAQRKLGLTIDGIAGPVTLGKLGIRL